MFAYKPIFVSNFILFAIHDVISLILLCDRTQKFPRLSMISSIKSGFFTTPSSEEEVIFHILDWPAFRTVFCTFQTLVVCGMKDDVKT